MSERENKYNDMMAQVGLGMNSRLRRPSQEYKDVYEALKQINEMKRQNFSDISPKMLEAQEKLNQACESYIQSHAGARRTDRGKNRLDLISGIQQSNKYYQAQAMEEAKEAYGNDPERWRSMATDPVYQEPKKGRAGKKNIFDYAEEVSVDITPEEKAEMARLEAADSEKKEWKIPERPVKPERKEGPLRKKKKAREEEEDIFKNAVEVDLGFDDKEKAPEEKKAETPQKNVDTPAEKAIDPESVSKDFNKKMYNIEFSEKFEAIRKAASKNPSEYSKDVTSALAQMVYISKSNADLKSPEMTSANQNLQNACVKYEIMQEAGLAAGDNSKLGKLIKDVKNLSEEFGNVMEGKAPEKKAALKEAAGKDKKASGKKEISLSALEDKKSASSRKKESAAKKAEQKKEQKKDQKKEVKPLAK